jgi:ubiquinone/menaquinone biosynthesis C-methylase UbiE
MKSSRLKEIYNQDVIQTGGYLYTGERIYSACVATKKQTDEIHKLIQSVFNTPSTILDIGCGDGAFTFDMFRFFQPKRIVGVDIAEEAIRQAVSKIPEQATNISFEVGDIYAISQRYRKNEFQLGIIRGVLHHMEHPDKVIAEAAKIIDHIIILEPNGFNPILKLIEKLSPYHRLHGERSYWPPDIDRWFAAVGYEVISKKYFSIIPYFFPETLTKILKVFEPFIERIPLVNRFFCGGYLVYYRKADTTPAPHLP